MRAGEKGGRGQRQEQAAARLLAKTTYYLRKGWLLFFAAGVEGEEGRRLISAGMRAGGQQDEQPEDLMNKHTHLDMQLLGVSPSLLGSSDGNFLK